MLITRDHDRLLPADAQTRSIARGLYERVSAAPIISPHGHVPPRLIADDSAFGDPAELFICSDHYVTRLLHAHGESLESLDPRTNDPREIWRLFARRQRQFAGTAVSTWFTDSLESVFGIGEALDEKNADDLYDRIQDALARPEMRPRALFERFGIDVLATTDDPLDDLAAHRRLAADPAFPHRVLPTFRPDRYIDPGTVGFVEYVERLLASVGGGDSYDDYLRALRARRQHFIDSGAVSVDVGVESALTLDLDRAEAAAIFDRLRAGRADTDDTRRFRAHMLLQMAEMSVDDGLVLTIHAGVRRNHSSATFERFGPDTGHDIPIRGAFTDELRPMLERFGLVEDLHIVLFSLDETVFAREFAPLAGFYPSVFVGAPWWFLDAPDAIARWRSAITETAGFYRTAGFIDDTRAFLSIPARHDVSRRTDAAFLARYVVEARMSLATAEAIADDLVDLIPRKAFKL